MIDIQDRILFGMPEDPELYLAALAAVQDYGWQLVRQRDGKRRLGEWLLAIHSPNPKMEFLQPCFPQEGDWFEETIDGNLKRYTCPVDTQFVDEWEPRRGEWDFVYSFDGEIAYGISETTGQPAATVFGIMIGSAPKTELPSLEKLKSSEGSLKKDNDILVLPFDGQQELVELLEGHFPELSVSTLETINEKPEWDWINVSDSRMVIGPRSFATYAAASNWASIVELYPSDRDPRWLAKRGTNYQQVYGKTFPIGLIWRAIEEVMENSQWRTQTTIARL